MESPDKLNPEIKAKWLAALRSGEYPQSQDQLRSVAGYCCLGVLCDLHAKETKEGEWVGTRYHAGEYFRELNLPTPVRAWVGTTQAEPRIPWDGVKADPRWAERPNMARRGEDEGLISVAALNDTGYTFAEIADLIEAHL